MRFMPRDYQRITTDFVVDNQRCNAWLDMGMGKSVSTLTAADMLKLTGSNLFPILVLAPKRVATSVWPGECVKWDHLRDFTVSQIIGSSPTAREAGLAKTADIYTMNYDNLQWLVEQYRDMKKWPFKWVIADESTRLKGFRLRKGGKRAAALSKAAKYTGRWTNLTGTPVPKGLIDLWGQQWFVDYGAALGRTFTDFKGRWFDENKYTHKITMKPNAEAEIMSLIAPSTIALRAKDWFDVEEPLHMPVYIDLPAKARGLYRDMERDYYLELESGTPVEAVNAAVKMAKCLQLASGAIYTDKQGTWESIHDAKLDAMDDIIDETNGEPIIVSYWFKSDLARLQARYPRLRTLETQQDIDDWNAGKIHLLAAHPQSAGHGLNLQDGGFIIAFFSQTFHQEARQQIIERIGPIRQFQSGHPRPVLVYDLIVRGTHDETAQLSAVEKMEVHDAVMAARAMR